MARYFDGEIAPEVERVARAICLEADFEGVQDPDKKAKYWASDTVGPRWWLYVDAARAAMAEISRINAIRGRSPAQAALADIKELEEAIRASNPK